MQIFLFCFCNLKSLKFIWIKAHVNMMEDFWEKIRLRLSKYSHPVGNPQGCVEYRGQVPRQGGGYGIMKVKWPGSNAYKLEKAHRIAYMLHHRLTSSTILRKNEWGETLECSHICHMKTCINPEHIVLETHTANQGRITCVSHNVCHSGNHSGPPCIL